VTPAGSLEAGRRLPRVLVLDLFFFCSRSASGSTCRPGSLPSEPEKRSESAFLHLLLQPGNVWLHAPKKLTTVCRSNSGQLVIWGLMGPGIPCWAASVRFWVSDTVPHLSTQGRSCTESAPVFLFPADLHAPAENPKSSETPDGTASKTAWSGKWKWFPRKAQQPVRTHG